MKRRLIMITTLFSLILLLITGVFSAIGSRADTQDTRAEQIVAINELEQLAKAGDYETLGQKADALTESIRSVQAVTLTNHMLFLMCGICILFLLSVMGYVYFSILLPFERLKGFALQLSQGDFDIPLNYERSNYFGDFTWAFDSMRREITKARSCEREAIENNKTVIATLSHDIKTPIASIRAYAEGLEANMDSTPEKRSKYLRILMKKCDEVSRLTNDLFLHSLSDLDKLQISAAPLEICSFMENAVTEIAAGHSDVQFQKPDFTADISADPRRLMQITENLINNARKYAKSDITVSVTRSGDDAAIHFRDYGSGIPDEDLPFICDKFYRGKNCGREQGSGLGLYIVTYLTKNMDGTITLRNHTRGLEVIIRFPVIGEGS